MAFTKTPENQTYSSPRLPAAYTLDLRQDSLYATGGSSTTLEQDSGMVNLIPARAKVTRKQQDDEDKNSRVHAVTRQAITAIEVVNSNLVNRGCYVWEKTAGTVYYFSVNGTGVYSSTDATTWSLVNTLSTSTGPVRFAEFINDSNTKSLVMVDGTNGYVFTTNAAGTQIVDADFPTPHVPWPVFMDGYLFLAKANTGDIYNSNLNDPAAWTAGDFISSELYPDDVQALVKINNYILAIGLEGSEYFYDAANASGSPLARYEGGSLAFGTKFPNSIACNKRQIIMLSNNNDGEFVFKAVEDFKSQDLDPGFLVQVINHQLNAASPTTASSLRGYFLRQGGDLLYVLALDGASTSPHPKNKTFALNIETGMWTELRIGTNGEAPYPVYFVANATTQKTVTFVSGHYGGSPFFGTLSEASLAQDTFTNGAATQNIYTEIRTPNLDFETSNRKFMNRFGVEVTTNDSGTGGDAINLTVQWTNDDYQTWSDSYTLDVSPNRNYPFITQLGSFRRRAMRLFYNGTRFLRYKYLEFDINKGQQ